ncbi:hypothetical protein QTP70_034727 [Hemibagrus guttatus]|uniref:CUB domain-containing protein n=1 Tax=Hemibagrus guttatus TaxID=175788 RepID=A0AAE0USR7_9TELE|nr:hypothetical protein QTP70_034727 [Hemibagrus guttatus]
MWPPCLSVLVKEAWPVPVSSSKVGVASVPASSSKGSVASVPVRSSEGGVAFVPVRSSEGGVASVPVSSSKVGVASVHASSSKGGVASVPVSSSKGSVASVPVRSSEGDVASVPVSFSKGDLVKEVWPLCLSVLVKEAWPVPVSSSKVGVASVPASSSKGGVASVPVSSSKGSVTSVPVRSSEGDVASVPVSFSKGDLVKEVWPLCLSDLVKEVWPLCLSVLVKEAWPVPVSSSKVGVASVHASSSKGGVASVPVSSSKGSVASVPVRSSEGDVASVPVSFSKGAPPRQCIDLFFDEKYSIEPSWECKFDHIEVRDGPFGFSPIIGRYCGQQSPQYIRSSGRYLWIKFVADGELEAIGFSANYNFTTGKVYVYAELQRYLREGGLVSVLVFLSEGGNPELPDHKDQVKLKRIPFPITWKGKNPIPNHVERKESHSQSCGKKRIPFPVIGLSDEMKPFNLIICKRGIGNSVRDPDFQDMGVLKPLPACEFEMTGPEGIIESQQIIRDGKASQTEAVDCKWFIRAPPRSKIYLRFLDYEMQNSNECKRNFVAVYDGSGSVEDLKCKFCSTVASDVTLRTALGVVRMWSDEHSRRSRFRILYTTFKEPPCEAEMFFCHSNMCINNSLVCNGIQNCVYPWDENHCKVYSYNGNEILEINMTS